MQPVGRQPPFLQRPEPKQDTAARLPSSRLKEIKQPTDLSRERPASSLLTTWVLIQSRKHCRNQSTEREASPFPKKADGAPALYDRV